MNTIKAFEEVQILALATGQKRRSRQAIEVLDLERGGVIRTPERMVRIPHARRR
jgi:hypothetical protein